MDPEEEGKAPFHWALAGIIAPGLGLLLSTILAGVYAGRGGPWARRLVALAVVDVLVVLALLVLVRHSDRWPVAHAAEVGALAGYGVAAAVALAAWLGSLRRPGPRVWRGFFLAVALFIGGSLGASYVSHRFLIVLMAGHGCFALGAAIATAWLRSDRPAEPPPRLSPPRALLRAAYYTLTLYPRAGFLLAAADVVFFAGAGKPSDDLQSFAGTLRDPLGMALFALAVVVVGPIAEELVFRGFLLPRLAARIGRGWALAATSFIFGGLHSNYGIYAGLTVVLGAMLGWARLSSGGLTAPIALHMLINGVVTTIFFLRGP